MTSRDWWEEAACRVFADLAATSARVVEWRLVERPHDPTAPGPWLVGDGFELMLGAEVETADEAVWLLADQVQEAVLEELWGEPWPRCPGHPHPLALVAAREPVWGCPVTGSAVAAVGELGRTLR